MEGLEFFGYFYKVSLTVIYMKIEKRGVSPVIASVLLILLVFVLVAFVFSWARGFVDVSSVGNKVSSKELCAAVDFNIVVESISPVDTYNFNIVNRGNVDIKSLRFAVYSGGDSSFANSSTSVLASNSGSGSVVLGTFDKVDVLPVLDGELAGESSDVICINDPVYFS